MNKTSFIIMAVLLIPTVSAIEEQSAGITPDNPLWGIDVALDHLKIIFASDKQTARAEVALERLAEIQSSNKPERAIEELDTEITDAVVANESGQLDTELSKREKTLNMVLQKLIDKGVPTKGVTNALSRGKKS